MADITMCHGTNCPLKDQCYRHTAEANDQRQSYFTSPPYSKYLDKCEYVWPNLQQPLFPINETDGTNTQTTTG